MFDFAWSELALIAVVALIAIGPKDMPVAIRSVTDMIKKARRMAAEFHTHVDEMVRDADLHEVRNSINEIRNFDVRGAIERTVDPDRSIRNTFETNPLDMTPSPSATTVTAVVDTETVSELPAEELTASAEPVPALDPTQVRAPAFIPPNMVPPPEYAVAEPVPPSFIPPEVVAERRSRPSA